MPAGHSRRVQQYLVVLAVTWGATIFPPTAQALQRYQACVLHRVPGLSVSPCFWVLRTKGFSCCSLAGKTLPPFPL